MFRSLLLLLVLAGVAGYFTKPTEAQHRDAVSATLQDLQDAAASNLDLGAMVQTGLAQLSQDGAYTDYYVASRYTVSSGDRALADCWGAFTQVRCTPAISTGEGGASSGG